MNPELGSENYDVWRYNSNYNHFYKELGKDVQDQRYSGVNPLICQETEIFNEILTKFEEKGNYKDIITSNKDKLGTILKFVEKPLEIEEISRYLILCQLEDDEQSLQSLLRTIPIDFFSTQLNWQNLKVYESRRNLEIYIKTALCKNLEFKKLKEAWKDIYSKAKMVVNITPENKQYREYEGIYFKNF